MDRSLKIELTNMCLLYDDKHVLVQEKQGLKDKYKGRLVFPGGHVEPDESLLDSVIREMKEETGLTIHNPQPCGFKDWILEDGTRYLVIATLNAHKGIVWGLDYDGIIHRRLVSSASDKHVIMWDCSQNEIRKIKVVDAHNSSIWNVNYNHAGTQFVTTGDDSEFKVWDAIDFKLLYCIKGYTNLLRNIHISIERQSLFIAGDDMIIREYSLANLDVPRKIYIGHTNRVRHVDVSPNGKLLVSCGDDGNVILWNIERKTHKCYKGHKKRVWTVSFISNDEFVSAGEENDIYLWNMNSITPKILMGHSNWIWALSFFSEKNYSSAQERTTPAFCGIWTTEKLLLDSATIPNGCLQPPSALPENTL